MGFGGVLGRAKEDVPLTTLSSQVNHSLSVAFH